MTHSFTFFPPWLVQICKSIGNGHTTDAIEADAAALRDMLTDCRDYAKIEPFYRALTNFSMKYGNDMLAHRLWLELSEQYRKCLRDMTARNKKHTELIRSKYEVIHNHILNPSM